MTVHKHHSPLTTDTHGDESQRLSNEQNASPNETSLVKKTDGAVVRVTRQIVYNPMKGKRVDPTTVHFQYYNSFNYSMLTKDRQRVRLTIGVTSANRGEGKTLAASNLAVSLALGYQRKTVLVDLNMERPRLHHVFGTAMAPGMYEALHEDTICLSHTSVDHLSVLTVGALPAHRSNGESAGSVLVGLEHLGTFSEILSSLEQEFDFVIVDMPPINTRNFPILFTNQLNGLLVVVDTNKTNREDMDRMFRQVNEKQVLGFVLNRIREDAS